MPLFLLFINFVTMEQRAVRLMGIILTPFEDAGGAGDLIYVNEGEQCLRCGGLTWEVKVSSDIWPFSSWNSSPCHTTHQCLAQYLNVRLGKLGTVGYRTIQTVHTYIMIRGIFVWTTQITSSSTVTPLYKSRRLNPGLSIKYSYQSF